VETRRTAVESCISILEDPQYKGAIGEQNQRGMLWKVYDPRVLGVSALKPYRARFRAILFKDTPRGLIERMKNKTRLRAREGAGLDDSLGEIHPSKARPSGGGAPGNDA
jgi:hypothetical protein